MKKRPSNVFKKCVEAEEKLIRENKISPNYSVTDAVLSFFAGSFPRCSINIQSQNQQYFHEKQGEEIGIIPLIFNA